MSGAGMAHDVMLWLWIANGEYYESLAYQIQFFLAHVLDSGQPRFGLQRLS
jgi:hypothetical protein